MRQARYADARFCEEVGLESAQYLNNWALVEVLAMMQHHVSLGVELELFSAHECSSVFWYWEYLISAYVHILTAALASKEELERLKGTPDFPTTKPLQDSDPISFEPLVAPPRPDSARRTLAI